MSTIALRARSRYRPIHAARRLPAFALKSLGAVMCCVLLWGLWRVTSLPIVVTIDGIEQTIYTHRRTVAPLLLDLGITVHAADRVTPALTTRLTDHLAIRVERARPVRIWADGREWSSASWGETPATILTDAGIAFDAYDQVVMQGTTVGMTAKLPFTPAVPQSPTYSRGYRWDNLAVEPLQLRLKRAVPITVRDEGLPFTIRTTAQTIGEALRQAQITIYLGDLVQPPLGAQVTPGLRIWIERSQPVTLQMDGMVMKTRSRATSVGDALMEIGVGIAGLDRVEPALDTKLKADLEIRITRVREEVEIQEEILPYETVFQPDSNLAIDTQAVIANGAEGITRERYRVRYEDGQEVARTLEDRWVAQEAAQRVIAYGQGITPQTATMADGTVITYWRRIRMLASSYSAGTSGLAADHPWFGKTYSGEPMRKGVVAVDPRLIPMRAQVYVPGYGIGDALDTGTAIRARRIDLGYDDHNLELWNRWVDVYLLWPPPPSSQITWVLPNYPRVPE